MPQTAVIYCRTTHSPLLCSTSEPHKPLQKAKHIPLGWSRARQHTRTSGTACGSELHTGPSALRQASNSYVLQHTGRAQSSRPLSLEACTACSSTCCSAQQQHSSAEHYSPGHHSSSHQLQGSDQHTNTDQHQGPDISLLGPLLQRQWNHAKNAHLGNIVIKPYTRRRVWWECDQCPDGHPHMWQAQVSKRSSGISCPFCTNQRVCQHSSLATKHPDIAMEFSDRNQGTAHDYTAASNEAVFWRCNHGHEYNTRIASRTRHNTGCPICWTSRNSSQPKQKHPVLTDSPRPVMHLWDEQLNAKAGMDPNKITCRSRKICNWICHCCPEEQLHRWQAPAGPVCLGSGCPCCSGRKACTCNSLQSLFPEVAAEWDYTRNTGTPDECPAHSHRKVWWCTPKRGSFRRAIHARTRAVQRHTTK